MKKITVKIHREEDAADLPLPRYKTDGSSGMDLHADVTGEVILQPSQIKLVSTGLHVSIPCGYEAQIRPRSGLALKHGIGLVNSPGTIDSDYRGLLSIILINWGTEPFTIRRGDRIAQMVITDVVRAELVEHAELDETVRAHGGFGHTGR